MQGPKIQHFAIAPAECGFISPTFSKIRGAVSHQLRCCCQYFGKLKVTLFNKS
ncbi:MAG: hypothetical protein HRU34_01265 [Richelia sp.]|nr:hypothetical protein [Richelia sp.]